MRGFRWQLLALIISMFIFGLALGNRLINSPEPALPTATPQPATATPIPATQTPLPTAIPQITQAADTGTDTTQSVTRTDDDIPTFHEALIGNVQRLNPLLADLNPVDRDITSLIFEGLTRTNEYGEATGALAQNWIISGDGLEYVFTLRQDIFWQNGIQFTSEDVIYTMSLLSSADFPGNPEQSAFWRSVEVWKLNDFQIRFRLTQPLSSFPSLLTTGILPEHALRGTTASQLASHPFNLSPVGTGAYQLEAVRQNAAGQIVRVDLRPSPIYQQRPETTDSFAVARLSFHLYADFDAARNALNNGTVDGLAARNMQERLSLVQTGLPVYTGIAPAVGVLIFNMDEPEGIRFFQENRVRVGLQAGLNRSSPVDSHLSNQAILADSPLLLHSWAYEPNLPWQPVDVAAARDIINRANTQTGSTTQPEATDEVNSENIEAGNNTTTLYRFSILVPDTPSLTGLAQEIATQWSQLNLDVTVDAVPQEIFDTRVESGDFMTAIVELPLGADPDVFAYWHVGQYPDGKNYGGASDDKLSELLERARRETGGIARARIYSDFQKLFIERGVGVPLYYPLFTYVVDNRISGVQPGFISAASDRFNTIATWQIAPDS